MTAGDWALAIGANVAIFTTGGFLLCSQKGRRIVRFFKRLRIAYLEVRLEDCRDRLAKWDWYSHPDHWEWEDEKKGVEPWRT